MRILLGCYALPVSEALAALLEQEVTKSGQPLSDGVAVVFRDPDYSPERGGFHPVEVGIAKDGRILHITDFAYVGPPDMAELAKELDFDMALGLFGHMGRDYPIRRGVELFRLWQKNFLAYVAMGIFKVEVRPQ